MLRTGLLVDRLCAEGHEVTWLTSTFDHFRKVQAPSEGRFRIERAGGSFTLRLLRAPGYRSNVSVRRLVHNVLTARAFDAATNGAESPDAILVSYPTIELAMSAVRYGQRTRTPVVVDVRDLWPDVWLDHVPKYLGLLSRWAVKPWDTAARRVLQGCTAVLGISETYVEWGLRRAGRARQPLDRVFPLAYEPLDSTSAAVQRAGRQLRNLGVDPTRAIVWYVGTFGRSTDLPTVLRAATLLRERGLFNVQFVVSGEGESGRELRSMARGLESVVFTGWLDRTAIGYMLATAHIGLASYNASARMVLPNKVLEYLSAGLPVVSSLTGETQDVLTGAGAGVWYRAGDSSDLADVLGRLCGDQELRATMSARARELFESRFRAVDVYGAMVRYLAEELVPASGVPPRGSRAR